MSAISKINLLFPPFLRRKTDWEKTSKMLSGSTPSFKRNLIWGNVSERQNMRLFWNINTLNLSLPLSLRPQYSWQTHLHTLTVTCREHLCPHCAHGVHMIFDVSNGLKGSLEQKDLNVFRLTQESKFSTVLVP